MEIKQHFYRCLQLSSCCIFYSLPLSNDGLSKSVKEARNAEIISLGIKCNLHIKSSVAFNQNCRSGMDVEGGNLYFNVIHCRQHTNSSEMDEEKKFTQPFTIVPE